MSESIATAVERVRQASDALSAQSTPFPVPIGSLAPLVAGTVSALERTDWWVPGLRERAGAVLRDVSPERLADGLAGARPYKIAPPSASPALRALTATGLALAQSEGITVVHLGIGSVSDGAFHEALNLAALTSAPIVFVVAVQQLDDGAPLGPQSAASPLDLAAAYGLSTTEVDGSDASAVLSAVRDARDATPHLLCANL